MQITELAAKVQALGLTDKEAKVYVASLFLGPASVQKIAEQAEVNRATAYVILDQLAELGLVSQSTEGKKTVFVAEGPEALSHIFDREIERVQEKRKDLDALLPDLQQSQRADSESAPVVRFYKGREGNNAISRDFNRHTVPGSVGYGFVNFDEAEKIAPDILKTGPKERLKKKVSSKVIYSYKRTIPSNPKIMRETMKIDEPVKADISVRNDMAAFSTYAGKDSIRVVIESKEIVGALKQLFELAWRGKQS